LLDQQLGTDVERYRMRLVVEAECGGSEQDEETDVRQRVCDELGRWAAQRVANLCVYDRMTIITVRHNALLRQDALS